MIYGMTMAPLIKHKLVITIRAVLSKGSFLITLVADKAYKLQVNIKAAINIAAIGASQVPCLAESIITLGARANSNQVGPPTIHNKCQIAAQEAIKAPINNNLACMVNFILISLKSPRLAHFNPRLQQG